MALKMSEPSPKEERLICWKMLSNLGAEKSILCSISQPAQCHYTPAGKKKAIEASSLALQWTVVIPESWPNA